MVVRLSHLSQVAVGHLGHWDILPFVPLVPFVPTYVIHAQPAQIWIAPRSCNLSAARLNAFLNASSPPPVIEPVSQCLCHVETLTPLTPAWTLSPTGGSSPASAIARFSK